MRAGELTANTDDAYKLDNWIWMFCFNYLVCIATQNSADSDHLSYGLLREQAKSRLGLHNVVPPLG